jgi:ABC-type multidrug transport system fused ATPase/permease subunit
MKPSSLWNRLSFGWVSRELYQGYMHDEDYSMNCINELVHDVAPADNIKMPLLKNIFRLYKLQIILGGVLKLVGDLSSVYSVRLIKNIAEGFKKGQDQNESILSLLLLLLIHMIHTFGFNHHDYLMSMVGFQVRNQLSRQVYANCLSLNNISDRGMVLNLLSSDVLRVSLLFGSLHNIWVSLFPVFWILCSLYEFLGLYSVVGFSVTFLYIPAQYWLTKKMQELRKVNVCAGQFIYLLERFCDY